MTEMKAKKKKKLHYELGFWLLIYFFILFFLLVCVELSISVLLWAPFPIYSFCRMISFASQCGRLYIKDQCSDACSLFNRESNEQLREYANKFIFFTRTVFHRILHVNFDKEFLLTFNFFLCYYKNCVFSFTKLHLFEIRFFVH